MNSNIVFLMKLIAAAVGGREYPEITQDVDWKTVYDISKNHNITNLVGYAVLTGKYTIENDLKQSFLKAMSGYISHDMHQMQAFAELSHAFEKNGIKYMPLKGLVIKSLYPSSDMRNMSDGDILIDTACKDKLNDIMTELGYTFKLESNHELIYEKNPHISIELHKMLIPTYQEDLYEYYGDGWKLARQAGDTCKYELSNEDMFIYLIAHLAKHYRDAGVGIKQIIDLWIYRNKVELDMEYVSKQLEKLNLNHFYENIYNLTMSWFENREYDDVAVMMTEFIINSGTFGNIKNSSSAKAIRNSMNSDAGKGLKFKYLRLAFPDLRYMKIVFPVLEKAPVLLPFLWIVRLINGVLFKRNHISRHVSETEMMDSDHIRMYSKHMETVGIDIYNGRKKS